MIIDKFIQTNSYYETPNWYSFQLLGDQQR